MRISDWGSDGCSSDLIWAATDLGIARNDPRARTAFALLPSPLEQNALSDTNVHSVFVDTRGRIWLGLGAGHIDVIDLTAGRMHHLHQIGRASCRERVCQYV